MPLLSQGALFAYAEQMALNAILGVAQSPAPAPVYLALSMTAIGQLSSAETAMSGTTINEYPTASGYARQNLNPTAATLASPSRSWNTPVITWGPFTSAPGTCVWAIACDVASGGAAHPLASYILSTARTPAIGDSLQGNAGTGASGVGFICQV